MKNLLWNPKRLKKLLKKKNFKVHTIAVSALALLVLTMACQEPEEEVTQPPVSTTKKKDSSQPLTLEAVSEQNVHGGWQGKSAPYLRTGGFVVEGDFIYWRADEDGLDYAMSANASVSSLDATFDKPKISWDPGFKIGVGYTWEGQDFWDLFLLWTQFNTDQSGHKTASFANPSRALLPVWSPSVLDQQLSSARADWKLRFNTLDLELGRNYFISRTVALRPYAGIRGASILQNYDVKYNGIISTGVLGPNTHMKAQNNFKGIGALLGAQMKWHFTSDWSVFGAVGGSLLCGWYNIDQNLQGFESLAPIRFGLKDKFTKVATNLEASLGVEWEYFFSDDDYRLAISASYEFSEWFNQNRMKQFNLSDNSSNMQVALISTASQNGDLGLQGATVQVRFDF